jgi:hypothetical protein
MDCINAEKLLPLYARADLDTNSQSAISTHLQSCPHCRQLAAEYKDTQQLMRLYEPPEFSEEFFAGIRRNVLSQIEHRSAASRTWGAWLQGLIALPLSQRMAVTASAALLIFSCAVALYLVRTKSPAVYETTAGVGMRDERVKSDAQIEPGRKALQTPVATGSPEHKPGSLRGSKNRSSAISLALNRDTRRRLFRSVPQNSRETQDVATVAVKDTLARTSESPAITASPVRSSDAAPTAAQSPLRMELQTTDPNIRIIWFTSNGKQSTVGN